MKVYERWKAGAGEHRGDLTRADVYDMLREERRHTLVEALAMARNPSVERPVEIVWELQRLLEDLDS